MIGTQVTSESEQGTSLSNTARAPETLRSTISDATAKTAGLGTMGLAHFTSLRADHDGKVQGKNPFNREGLFTKCCTDEDTGTSSV